MEFVQRVIERVHKIRELLNKEWINMAVLDPQRSSVYRFANGEWIEIERVSEEVRA